jgi:hypothetical protein
LKLSLPLPLNTDNLFLPSDLRAFGKLKTCRLLTISVVLPPPTKSIRCATDNYVSQKIRHAAISLSKATLTLIVWQETAYSAPVIRPRADHRGDHAIAVGIIVNPSG